MEGKFGLAQGVHLLWVERAEVGWTVKQSKGEEEEHGQGAKTLRVLRGSDVLGLVVFGRVGHLRHFSSVGLSSVVKGERHDA
jgi:hypothetical protein